MLVQLNLRIRQILTVRIRALAQGYSHDRTSRPRGHVLGTMADPGERVVTALEAKLPAAGHLAAARGTWANGEPDGEREPPAG